MLFLVGLGLSDERDVSVKGLDVIRRCDHVFLENYTSILFSSSVDRLEECYGRSVIVADRECVESNAEMILSKAVEQDVALLVVGDPFGATTHADFLLRAHLAGIETKVIHNASVMNSVGECGLQLYAFGPTVSIPFYSETWRPVSFYFRLRENKTRGLHTLCLLDIKVKEQSEENLIRGIKKYEPPRFMTIAQALSQLSWVEDSQKGQVVPADCLVVGLARLGADDQVIAAGCRDDILNYEFNAPLHCLILVGVMDEVEMEVLLHKYRIGSKESFIAAYQKYHSAKSRFPYPPLDSNK